MQFLDVNVEEDRDRATSWYEFLVHPELLDKHLQRLNQGIAKNPSGSDLLKIFLKQALLEDTKRAQLLRSFAVKTAQDLNMTLEVLEEVLPAKHQRELLEQAAQIQPNNVLAQVDLHRWNLRRAMKSLERAEQASGGPSLEFLQKWLQLTASEREDLKTKDAQIVVNFEIGEYLFYSDQFSAAEPYFKTAKETTQRDKKKSIDAEKLRGYLLACHTIMGVPIQQELETAPMMLTAEKSRINNDLEGLVKAFFDDILLDDPKRELPWPYRINIASDTPKIKERITILNFIKRISKGEPPIEMYGVGHLGFPHLKFLFESSENVYKETTARFPLRADTLSVNLKDYLHRICAISGTIESWQLLKSSAFSTPLCDIEIARAKQQSDFVTQAKKNSEILNIQDKEDLLPDFLKQNPQLEAHSVEKGLSEKAFQCLEQGQFRRARKLYALMGAKNVMAIYGSQVVELNEHLKNYEQQDVGSLEKTEKLCSNLHVLLSKHGAPQYRFLEFIMSFFITTMQLEAAKKYCSMLRGILEATLHKEFLPEDTSSHPAEVVISDLTASIADLVLHCVKYMDSIEGMLPIEEQKVIGLKIVNPFESLLGKLIELKPPKTDQVRQRPAGSLKWSSQFGLLSRIGTGHSIRSLEYLAALSAGALYYIRKAKKASPINDPLIDRYGSLALLAGGSTFFANSQYVTVPTEFDVMEVFRSTVERLHALQPENSRWIYGLGDTYFDEAEATKDPLKYRECIKNYIRAGALETSFYTTQAKIPKTVAVVVRRLITSLAMLKCHTQAVVLCQHLPSVDYNLAFKIMNENVNVLDPEYFQYIWEMPILELLAYLFTKAKDTRRQSIVLQLIAKPELNQYNAPEILEVFTDHMKMEFFKRMSREYLA